MKLYVASSVAVYQYPEYETVLKQLVERLYPDAEKIYAKGMFANARVWTAQWPALLDTLDALVFFSDKQGYIGRGVYVEIEQMCLRGKPVFYITWGGKQFPLADITLKRNLGQWKQYARIEGV